MIFGDREWALCRSHGTESTMLESNRALGHPKQRKFKFDLLKLLCFGCSKRNLLSNEWQILNHVTVSCKMSIGDKQGKKV